MIKLFKRRDVLLATCMIIGSTAQATAPVNALSDTVDKSMALVMKYESAITTAYQTAEITGSVNPADIATLESLAQEAGSILPPLKEMTATDRSDVMENLIKIVSFIEENPELVSFIEENALKSKAQVADIWKRFIALTEECRLKEEIKPLYMISKIAEVFYQMREEAVFRQKIVLGAVGTAIVCKLAYDYLAAARSIYAKLTTKAVPAQQQRVE